MVVLNFEKSQITFFRMINGQSANTKKPRYLHRSLFLQLLGQVSGYGVCYDKDFFLIQERKWYLLYSMFFNANMNFPPTFKNLPPNYSRSSPKSSQRVGRSACGEMWWMLITVKSIDALFALHEFFFKVQSHFWTWYCVVCNLNYSFYDSHCCCCWRRLDGIFATSNRRG